MRLRRNNPTSQENRRSGTEEWKITSPATIQPGRRREIEGFASLTSVNAGDSIDFYIHTEEPGYSLSVFRLGWYGGRGGRRMTWNHSNGSRIHLPGMVQPIPPQSDDGCVDCLDETIAGDEAWESSYTLQIPDDWVSGVYVALLSTVSGKQTYIIFVVRDDGRSARYMFQCSVTTYQAYNEWPFWELNASLQRSPSLYHIGSTPEGSRVSFHRPYGVYDIKSTYPHRMLGSPGLGAGDFFYWEFNMLRWLEREGYDINYCTNVDTHANQDLLHESAAFLSLGHDEYWSGQMYDNVERARNRGTNLGFFSANVCYRKIHFFNDSFTQFGIPERGGAKEYWKHEQELIGVRTVAMDDDSDIVVANPDHWVCRGADFSAHGVIEGLLGYECDSRIGREITERDDGTQGTCPVLEANVVAKSPCSGPGPSEMTVYESPVAINTRSALVFATGTIQWSWGLDDFHFTVGSMFDSYDRQGVIYRAFHSRINYRASQMTKNVMLRLGNGQIMTIQATAGNFLDWFLDYKNLPVPPPSGGHYSISNNVILNECRGTGVYWELNETDQSRHAIQAMGGNFDGWCLEFHGSSIVLSDVQSPEAMGPGSGAYWKLNDRLGKKIIECTASGVQDMGLDFDNNAQKVRDGNYLIARNLVLSPLTPVPPSGAYWRMS